MSAIDPYNYNGPIDSPVPNLAAVTPSDASDLSFMTRGVHVGTAGDLKVTTAGGQTVVITGATAGWHPIRVSRIWSTGTTASGITAGW